MIQPPLLGLLGAAWSLGSAVSAIAWSHGGAAVGFALMDGSVAIARIDWRGAPALRARPGGGVEVVPAAAPPPPLVRAIAHGGGCLAITGSGAGFLSGGSDGRLVRIAGDGTVAALAGNAEGPVLGVAETARGWAFVAGDGLQLGDAGGPIRLPAEASGLDAAPGGGALAIAHAAGVTVWRADRRPAHGLLPDGGAGSGRSGILAWNRDGSLFADAGHLWAAGETPAPRFAHEPPGAAALAFSRDGAHLVTAGAVGVAIWPVDGAASESCGPAGGRERVTALASHPRRDLLAIGYDNGAVVLCPVRGSDLMFARAAGGGPVTGLAFAPDGGGLAIGTAGGEVGLIRLPDLLFRGGSEATQEGAER